jgi:uncharacterized membrane protein YeaQ/YmgE (transglycosylase-associated protein family)
MGRAYVTAHPPAGPAGAAGAMFAGWTGPGKRRHQRVARTNLGGDRMGIIAFIILGLLAGIIAKWILPGEDPGGIIVTTLIGIGGALLGGFLAGAIFDADPLDEFFDISTWLTAIVGAIILLVIYRLIVGARAAGRGTA